MKNLLLCFAGLASMLLLFSPPSHALVVTRVTLVSNTYNTPAVGQGTLILDVESSETGAGPFNIKV